MNADNFGGYLSPRKEIGVVLAGSDKDDRVPQSESVDQFVYGTGAATADKDESIFLGSTDGVAEDLAGLVTEQGRLEGGDRGCGVGVAVAG